MLNRIITGVRQTAEISNLMMSVERVLEYRDLEKEKQPEKPQELADSWPTEGCIEFRNVFYRYFQEGEPVLRGLSFVIKPKEKIGINPKKMLTFVLKLFFNLI